MIISTLIGIFGVGLELIESIPCIVTGRIIYGAAGGVYSVCVGRYVEETAPHQHLSFLHPIYICGTSVAKMLVFLIVAGLPEDSDK